MVQKYKIEKGLIELSEGNIVNYKADAIVCPTNPRFIVGNLGTSGAIKEAAGIALLDEVDRLSELYKEIKFGDAYVTTAGDIPIKYVIHAVCTDFDPRRDSGVYSNTKLIREATSNSLRVANGLRLNSIGFPALGTGMGGAPFKDGVNVMLEEFAAHLRSLTSLEKIGLILYGNKYYNRALEISDNFFNYHYKPSRKAQGGQACQSQETRGKESRAKSR